MKIEKDKKYWEDYTEFLTEVKKLTKLSPAELLLSYKLLIEELNDIGKNYHLEWLYELDYDVHIRQEIQKIIDHKLISENTLLKEFEKEIENMDLDFKKYVLNPDKNDWWNSPELKFKQK